MWAEFKEHLKEDSITEDDYVKMLHASMVAGMAITHTGTSLPHGLSYPITYELHVPHGKAVGMFLPAFLRNYVDTDAVNKVLGILGFGQLEDFEYYMKGLLGPVVIPETLWEKDVESLLNTPAKLANYPYEMTAEVLRTFYN